MNKTTPFSHMVAEEQEKQSRLWGADHDAQHSPAEWSAILSHEVGCFADAALNDGDLLAALVKIAAVSESAAVALGIVE